MNTQSNSDALPLMHCSPFVFCEADLKKGRTIKAEQGEGVFRFTLKDGRKTRKIEMSDDEAWVVGKIISAMHPHISGSNDPLWHQIQEQRKIILENANMDLPDTAAQDFASKSNNPAVSG
jgi:hypothetical protein